MKRLIHIVGILLLTSCHQPSGVDVRDTTDNITENTVCQKDYHMEPVIYDTIFGHFITPRHTDTLILKYYSATTNRLVDSIAVGNRTDMDAAPWFYAQGIGIRVYLPDGTLVHTQPNATGLICAIPLNNLLPKTNALAIVWYPRQESGIMPCRIVSIENGQWTELGSFMVNTNFFPDTLTDGMIDDFLEKHNGIWMYRDYDEQMRWYEEHEGKCPMKPLRNILDTKSKVYNFQENLDYLCFLGFYEYVWAFEHYAVDSADVDSVAIQARKMNLRMTPYKTLPEIKKEFNELFDNWLYCYNTYRRDLWLQIIRSRMRFHLSNPVTYRYWQPTSEYNPFKVSISPDKKYKFYTTRDVCDGTAGEWITFYQYIDDKGNITCKEWQDDRRFDCQGNVVGVWQFTHHDTTFYVLKSVWQGSSCEWAYCMEIATFDKGIPTYHIHFFPDMKEYNEIKKWTYVNGEWKESDWVKEDGSYCVSYTCQFLDVNYDFNPKTLMVTAITQADTGDTVVKKQWKLKLHSLDTAILYGYYTQLQGDYMYHTVVDKGKKYDTIIEWLTQYIERNKAPKSTYRWKVVDSPNGPHHFGIMLGIPDNTDENAVYQMAVVNAHICLALAYKAKGNEKKFVEYMNIASRNWPNVVSLDYLWQYFRYEKKNFAMAHSIANRMIQAEPDCHLGYLRRAQTFNSQGKYKDAVSPANKAIECKDVNLYYNDDSPYYVRAMAYIGSGQVMKGFKDCQKYTKDGWGCTCGNDIYNFLIENANKDEKKAMLKALGVSDDDILQKYYEWKREQPTTTMEMIIDYMIYQMYGMSDFVDVMQ